MNVVTDFVTVGDFNFDPSLVKGWYIQSERLGILTEEPETVEQLVVLYDCFQIPFPDEDHAIRDWLKDNKKPNM